MTLRRITTALAGAGAMALLAMGGAANAETFEISITNLTNAQIFSPPLVAAHPSGTAAFSAGQSASAGIEDMAENGATDTLADALEGIGADVEQSGGPVLPGDTVTLTLTTGGGNRLISAVGMLVGTNDAFFGLGAVRPRGKSNTYRVVAYDAGTEDNDEICAHIPGPPCAASGNLNPDGATDEGGNPLQLDVVHVHRGIQNVGDAAFDSGTYDWRNPVAQITITRVPGDG